jgi:uncharacterized protein (DUF983 family)
VAGQSGLLETIESVMRQRCPRCHRGRMFRDWIRMYDACPVCRYIFEREPGYFVGAMYVSYALAVPTLGLLAVLVHWFLPTWSGLGVLGVTVPLFLPLAPGIFRYSRVIWAHLDWAIDPGG